MYFSQFLDAPNGLISTKCLVSPSQYDWNKFKETLNPSTNKQTNMPR